MSLLFALAASLAERIKVNATSLEDHGGRPMLVKRRRRSAPLVLAGANLFFRLAGCPVEAIADGPGWQRWEVDSFHRLHGREYRAFAVGNTGVAVDRMPGTSLARFLDSGAMTTAMAAAAGRELRRGHELGGGDWSHGDPHAGNFLFHAADERARLIDFELVHRRHLPAVERQADDLLVFLQDVVGRVPRSAWLPLSRAFLSAYGRPSVLQRLAPRLIVPRGIARLWWAVRTAYLPSDELASRFEELRETLTPAPVPARA